MSGRSVTLATLHICSRIRISSPQRSAGVTICLVGSGGGDGDADSGCIPVGGGKTWGSGDGGKGGKVCQYPLVFPQCCAGDIQADKGINSYWRGEVECPQSLYKEAHLLGNPRVLNLRGNQITCVGG